MFAYVDSIREDSYCVCLTLQPCASIYYRRQVIFCLANGIWESTRRSGAEIELGSATKRHSPTRSIPNVGLQWRHVANVNGNWDRWSIK